MKRIISSMFLALTLSSFLFLSGCTENQEVVETNTLTVEACMQDVGLSKSVQGKNLVYYYKGPEELSLYYVNNWKNGVVSLKKYYINNEKYKLEKEMYSNANFNDKNLTMQIKEYLNVEDMDAYWTQIENSETYTIVK